MWVWAARANWKQSPFKWTMQIKHALFRVNCILRCTHVSCVSVIHSSLLQSIIIFQCTDNGSFIHLPVEGAVNCSQVFLFVFNFKTLLFKKQTQYHPPYPYPKSIRGHARITISKMDSSNKHRITALLKCWRVWLKHKPYYVLESQSPRSSFPGRKKITASISTNKQQSMSLALTCLGLLAAPTSRDDVIRVHPWNSNIRIC